MYISLAYGILKFMIEFSKEIFHKLGSNRQKLRVSGRKRLLRVKAMSKKSQLII